MIRWLAALLLLLAGSAHAQSPAIFATPCFQGGTCNFIGTNITSQVPTNAALKALTAGQYNVVYRAGFNSAGDGGGAIYNWSASQCSVNGGAGDNGSQVQPNNGAGCWIAAFGSDIDVRVFGATGNGSSSDSAAISAAATAANAAGGRKLRFPATGHAYVLGTGVTLPSLVSVEGDGMANWPGLDGSVAQWTSAGSWIECEDTVNPCMTLSGVGNVVRNINFIVPQSTPPTSGSWTPTIYPYVLEVNGSANFSGIENVSITSATHCIDYEGPSSGVAGIWSHLDHIWFNGCFVRGTKFHLIDNTVSMHDLRYDNWWYANYSPVVTYIEANKVDWDLQYLANPQASDIEFFQSYQSISLTDATVSSGFGNVTFAVNNLQGSNISFNEVCQGIAPAASTTHGSGNLTNVIAAGDTTTNCYATPTYMFDFSSNYGNWTITGLKSGYLQSVAAIGGTSTVRIVAPDIEYYSAVNTGGVAFGVSAGGDLTVAATPWNTIRPATGAGAVIGCGKDSTCGTVAPNYASSVMVGTASALTLADGELGLRRIAQSATAPGAGGLKLSAVCGTNTGTAAIIAYAGTSTTPVFIANNIGSGVTGC